MNTIPKFSDYIFDWIFSILCIITISGFFISRAFVASGSIALVILTCFQFGPKQTLRHFWSNHFNRFALLLLIASALSILWSSNTEAWKHDTVTKLSFLALPLGFSVITIHQFNVLKRIVLALNILILITVINSLVIYISDVEKAVNSYMLTTTLYGDHIRFSFSIALTIIFNLYLLFECNKKFSKVSKVFIACCSLLFFSYLHMLSARTGLLCAYVGIGVVLLVKAWRKKPIYILGVVLAGILFPLAAIKLSPRLNEKVTFMLYEYTHVKDKAAGVQYNYSDNNRVLSYTVAWENIKDNVLLGIGSGDVRDNMKATYKTLYPDIPEEGRLGVPHMQFLSTAMAMGIPLALICIIGMLIAPLFLRYRHRLYISVNMLMMFVYFMVDAHLEIQFGILIFLFFTQLWMITTSDYVKDSPVPD